jgi:hypothetical protein
MAGRERTACRVDTSATLINGSSEFRGIGWIGRYHL